MAWFSRFTRFGDVHLVYGQEAGMSCGIASVLMCIFKLNKLKPGREAVAVEKDVYKEYAAIQHMAVYDGSIGTYPNALAAILTKHTEGNWRWWNLAPTAITTKLVNKVGITGGLGPTVDVEPVILGVDWDLGGAHWVVVDTIRQPFSATYATICDPWDTNVHIQEFKAGSAFRYDAATGGFMVNFGGTNQGETQPYQGNAAKGMVKTWGLICRD